jgi:DNA mismatch endonuclease, patch repair protein
MGTTNTTEAQAHRSYVMSRVKSKDTEPELKIRRRLHARGFRYRLHVPTLPGKPDVVLPKYKVALQVRGCFWHGHSCIGGRKPKTNTDYWKNKINGNRKRDKKNDRILVDMGWRVFVVWGCEISTKKKLEQCIERLGVAIKSVRR